VYPEYHKVLEKGPIIVAKISRCMMSVGLTLPQF